MSVSFYSESLIIISESPSFILWRLSDNNILSAYNTIDPITLIQGSWHYRVSGIPFSNRTKDFNSNGNEYSLTRLFGWADFIPAQQPISTPSEEEADEVTPSEYWLSDSTLGRT